MNQSSDGCRSFGNGSGSALRTVDVMGAGSPCARADRTPASSISADIARYSSGGKRTICSRVHTDTPPGTNPRIPRGCCIEVSTTGSLGAGCDARREGCTLDPTRAVVIAPRRRGDVGVSRRILRWEGRARCRRGCVPRSVRTAGRRVPLTRQRAELDRCQIIQGAALRWGARRDDDDGLATEGQDTGSGYRRCRC